MKEIFIKIPVYWFQSVLKDMDDSEKGSFMDFVIEYGFTGKAPYYNEMTDRQKQAWQICRRDLDYQKLHPRCYKFPDDEKIAIRRSGEYNNWRRLVFERDEYTCQSCGQHGGILNAHHIKPFSKFPDLRLDINNGITLCKDCHRGVHKGEIVLDLVV